MLSKSLKTAYTIGEPAGIGPDIILQLAQKTVLSDLVCIGDSRLLKARATRLGLNIELLDESMTASRKGQLAVREIRFADHTVCGEPNVSNVPAVLRILDSAIDGCLQGEYAAMVTGPLHKGIVNQAGIIFSGHTEYLAARTNTDLPVMLLATPTLRVALVTTHLPLKEVSAAITKKSIKQVCGIVDHDLRTKFRIERPRLLVCGLNPHAGESGHLGMEEIEVITPALKELREEGIEVVGPLPADTLFTAKYLATADVAIAMYHDQGLPVLKSQGFGEAANITLGLPIIRTSVDHGTAFDIAGTGSADIGSLETALSVAEQLTRSD